MIQKWSKQADSSWAVHYTARSWNHACSP